jgi:hypothetical protein
MDVPPNGAITIEPGPPKPLKWGVEAARGRGCCISPSIDVRPSLVNSPLQFKV